MRNKSMIFVVVFLLCFSVVQPVLAQQAVAGMLIERVDLDKFPTVTMRLSAWGEDGLPPTNLRTADILIQEGSAKGFHPLDVQSDIASPVSVILVLDVSGSMSGQPLVDAKTAAVRFLDRLTKKDQAALLAFSDTVNPDPKQLDPELEIGFTNNMTILYDSIDGLEARDGTHLYNALSKAAQMAADLPGGHRAVLLLSDGKNEPAGVGQPDEAIQLAKKANLPVFVIGLGNEVDEDYLRRLAAETGGLYRGAPRSSELAALFNDMATLLKTQYTLTYSSQLPANGNNYDVTVLVDAVGISAQQKFQAGVLPVIAVQPGTAVPTPTLPPTAVPATLATAIVAPSPVTPVPAFPWWMVFVGGLILLAIIFFVARRRKKPAPEACAKCGADVTGMTGACPKCGDIRRLPKPTRK